MSAENLDLDLTPLLSPQSVVIIGASGKGGSGGYADRLLNNLIDGGFDPKGIYLVNPKYDQIDGMVCYPHLDLVPGPIDLAVIVLSRKRVLSALKQCVDTGIKSALILSAGFAEAGETGRKEQQKISIFAQESGLLICGPNSLGLVNPAHQTMIHGYFPLTVKPGKVGLVSQSGAMAFAAILAPALDRNVRFSHVVSTGNEAALESIDFIRHFIQSKEVKAVCCFLEGFKDAKKFIPVAEEALEAGKAIIAVKVGRTDKGAQQAISHTGAITGSDGVYEAVFHQKGVIRVPYPDDLIEVANLFTMLPPPSSEGVLIVSTSGGMCSLLSDMCGLHHIDLPSITKKQSLFIKEQTYLLTYGEPINPLDIRGQGSVHLPEILQPFLDDGRYGVIVVSLGVAAVGDISKQIAEPLVQWAEHVEKPIVVLWMGNRLNNDGFFSDDDGFRLLEKSRIPVFYSPEKLIRALSEFIGYRRFRQIWLERRQRGQEQPLADIDKNGARSFIENRNGVLDEIDSRRLLSYYGIPAPREVLVKDEKTALTAAHEIGFPIALKLISPDVPHKTESGMVCLNIDRPDTLSRTLAEMLDSAEKINPGGGIPKMR